MPDQSVTAAAKAHAADVFTMIDSQDLTPSFVAMLLAQAFEGGAEWANTAQLRVLDEALNSGDGTYRP